MPDNTDDIIDSRDVISRIDDLDARLACDHCGEPVEPAPRDLDTGAGAVWVHTSGAVHCDDDDTGESASLSDPLDNDESAELDALRKLAEDGADYCPDWEHGTELVRDSYFKDYAMQFAEDIGAISSDAAWPRYAIDWNAAAADLRVDYTALDFDGVTYWAR